MAKSTNQSAKAEEDVAIRNAFISVEVEQDRWITNPKRLGKYIIIMLVKDPKILITRDDYKYLLRMRS